MQSTTDQNKFKTAFAKHVISEFSGMILNKKYRKDLIDVMNKYIEHAYRDSMQRINYNISDIDLADRLNKFIAFNNKSFNRDLASLSHRYMNQNYSRADGFAFSSLIGDTTEINTTIDLASQASSGSSEVLKQNEDQIKIALINKGIQKKRIVKRKWIVFLIIVVVCAIVIYLLVKANKKGQNVGEVIDDDISDLSADVEENFDDLTGD
jgi:hypothetical protein